MKTKIELFCDISSIDRDDKPISRLVVVANYMKKLIKLNISITSEVNNNKAELYNVINALYIAKSIRYDIRANHPIIIYSDSRYAIDTMNQLLSYVKKIRGNPELYKHYIENGYCKPEKYYRYYSYSKARRRIISSNKNPDTLIIALIKLMNTNNITFKWIAREDNIIADELSKIKELG